MDNYNTKLHTVVGIQGYIKGVRTRVKVRIQVDGDSIVNVIVKV